MMRRSHCSNLCKSLRPLASAPSFHEPSRAITSHHMKILVALIILVSALRAELDDPLRWRTCWENGGQRNPNSAHFRDMSSQTQ